MQNDSFIHIKGARTNNLKNIEVCVPRQKLVVITGLSGSGKSSLAFDTLYAEGQRRYVESLSAYARQFLGRMRKPECDFIKGIPPSIAIEQKTLNRNPRSTVGTSTEVYEYLRLLFARIGHTFSPVSGEEVRCHTPQDVVNAMLEAQSGARFMLLCPLIVPDGRPLALHLDICLKNGFSRVERRGEVMAIRDAIAQCDEWGRDEVYLVIDRMTAGDSNELVSRLTDSAETAFYEGNGECVLAFSDGRRIAFCTRFEADGIAFEKPSDGLFAFNSPAGACPQCGGVGVVQGIDERLVIPDTSLSVYQDAVACWRGPSCAPWKTNFILQAGEAGFPCFKPYYQLSPQERDFLWHGIVAGEKSYEDISIDGYFKWLQAHQHKVQYRAKLNRFMGKTTCPTCHGQRLRPQAAYVQVCGCNIQQLVEMPIEELLHWGPLANAAVLPPHEQKIAARLLGEIVSRLTFLVNVGLGYLTLNRASHTLSGGESQRINLATSLGSSLVGSLYILDEPSIGLHSRDTQRLIGVLKQLRDLGNTVVVVEHDEDIIQAADWIIDIGPEAGRHGGEVVFEGTPVQLRALGRECLSKGETPRSHTVAFLSGADAIALPSSRRQSNEWIKMKGVRSHNLKGFDVQFPLHVLTCVTGVSGSGKSSLVHDILYTGLRRELGLGWEVPGEFGGFEGDIHSVGDVVYVGANPIGTSSRSNPATYLKVWDEIRRLMTTQPLAQQMGYTPSHFSFNIDGGRCDECKGEGTVTVEMQFMADLVLECESCHGERFKKELLDVRFEGANVNDILNMTVNQAVEFFETNHKPRIVQLLRPLQDVGLGYIKLGQSSSTLSGGENQRLKLAYYLSQDLLSHTLFIFDEPTTGLHLFDIKRLLAAFDALIKKGHSIVVIEHNTEVAKCADYIIDLGPESGDKGGQLVATGTPEQIAACAQSYTAQFLCNKL